MRVGRKRGEKREGGTVLKFLNKEKEKKIISGIEKSCLIETNNMTLLDLQSFLTSCI